MLKCKYSEDCSHYPDCGQTCGLSLQELLFLKNEEIRDLKRQMISVRKDQLLLIEKAVYTARERLKPEYYIPTCPCGCDDCVLDPAYIRDTRLEWWEELGMPTKCDMYEVADNGEIYCCHYDDEDK